MLVSSVPLSGTVRAYIISHCLSQRALKPNLSCKILFLDEPNRRAFSITILGCRSY